MHTARERVFSLEGIFLNCCSVFNGNVVVESQVSLVGLERRLDVTCALFAEEVDVTLFERLPTHNNNNDNM